MDTIPPLSTVLIRMLDESYPPIRSADVLKYSEKELAFKAGQRSLIELMQLRETQAKEIRR